MAPDVIDFNWLTGESAVSTVVDALLEAGVDLDSARPAAAPAHLLSDTDDARFEPLLLIAGAAAIAHLAKAISRILRDNRSGGIVIENKTGKAVTIHDRVRGVDAGTVVVLTDGGAQIFSSPDHDSLPQWLKR